MTLEESREFVRDAVCDALRVADIKHEAAAAMLGVPPGQFSKQLAGTGKEHLSVQRLVRITDHIFWFVFLAKLRARMQIVDLSSPEVAHALQQLMVSVGSAMEKQRMAKASLPEGVSERRRKIA